MLYLMDAMCFSIVQTWWIIALVDTKLLVGMELLRALH